MHRAFTKEAELPLHAIVSVLGATCHHMLAPTCRPAQDYKPTADQVIMVSTLLSSYVLCQEDPCISNLQYHAGPASLCYTITWSCAYLLDPVLQPFRNLRSPLSPRQSPAGAPRVDMHGTPCMHEGVNSHISLCRWLS